jgi:hypothetical protein
MSTTELAAVDEQELMTVQSTSNLVLDEKSMAHMMNVATFMSKGTLTLPEPYRNNAANCLAVVMQAAQWKMNPFAVAQKTHFVQGNIGYEAQLVAAVINGSGATKDNFHFEWYGDWSKILGKFKEVESKEKKDDRGFPKKYKFPDWTPADEVGLGVKVWATLKGEDEPRTLDLLLTQAQTRNSTLWADDPRQQLAYLAQKRWARLYAPGVILGVYSPDEAEQMQPSEKEINPRPKTGAAAAEAAKAVNVNAEQAEKRASIIKTLDGIAAKDGLLAYGEAWMKLEKSDRTLVGADEHARLKGIAEATDKGKTVDGEVTDSFVEEMTEAEKQNG